jgi:pyridoxamine 5'-phosphate oxidase family protein
VFTEREREFLAAHRLASIATVSPDGEVDVAPVGYRFDGERFLIGGRGLTRTLKYKNVAAGSARVAVSIEDGDSTGPRGLKVHGTAELVTLDDGREVIAVTPTRSWSWGIEEPAFKPDGTYVLNRSHG